MRNKRLKYIEGFVGSGYNFKNEIFPPNASEQLVMLSGEVLNVSGTYYLKDLRNGKNFLITGYDWSDDPGQSFKVIPYRTAATISAPAGDSALIAADINNFLYDAVGTPNQIPVVSFFQNIDYENKIFCKEISQVTNSTTGVETKAAGIKYITVYSAAQTGNNLTSCNTFFSVPTENANAKWVAKKNLDGTPASDATGDGSKANPYLTIEKAYKTFSSGTIIYVKSGIYYEEYNSTTLRYLWLDKATNLKSLGFSTIRSVNTSFTIRTIASETHNITGFVIDGEATTDYPFGCYLVNMTVNIDKCIIKRPKTYSIYAGLDASVQQINVINSIINGSIYNPDGCVISKSLLNNLMVSKLLAGSSFTYNKCVNSYVYYNANCNVKYNSFNANQQCLASPGNLSGTLVIEYNTFNCDYSAITSNTYTIWTQTTDNLLVPTIRHNRFVCNNTGALSYYCRFINLNVALTPVISNNNFYSTPTSGFDDIYLSAAYGTVGKCTISNNWIKNNTLSGIMIALGSETTQTGVFDESEIYNNHIIGSLYDLPNSTATTHAILLNAGINMKFAFNKVEYCWLGLVIKTGTGQTYTSGGAYSNLFINNGRDIWGRKIKGLIIANNTLYGTSDYDKYLGGRIYLDSFDGYTSENCSIVNNIIYQTSSYYRIGMDLASYVNCKLYNCTLSPTGGNMVYNGSNFRTFDQATSDGVFIDCTNENANISESQLRPTTPITGGKDLGTDYDDGLDITTNWGSSTQVPVIVTKQQSTNWQIGAYIQ